MKTVAKNFFRQYPDAPYVFLVGEELFLANAERSATIHANKNGMECQKVDNPKFIKKEKAITNGSE